MLTRFGSQAEQLKKLKAKKAGGKKEEKSESVTEATKAEHEKAETEPEHTPEDANGDETKADTSESKDAEETVPELNKTPSHGRQPSISVQSKMRSSSFRAASGGPLSPGYGFSPDGDTAPDIYRKQAIRIEELEKENKRLTKEASDGERRYKKAEEELEDLREADEDSGMGKDISSGASSEEVEKLVRSRSKVLACYSLQYGRGQRSQLFSDKMPNSNHEPRDMDPLPPYLQLRPQISKPLCNLRIPPSSRWKLKSPIFELSWIG